MNDQQQLTAAIRDLRSAVNGLRRAIRPAPRRPVSQVTGPSQAGSWMMVTGLTFLVIGLAAMFGLLTYVAITG